MNAIYLLNLSAAVLLLSSAIAVGEIKIVVEHKDNGQAAADFKFKTVPLPAKNDAATNAKFILVDGRPDANGGDLGKLHDGRVPTEEDQPAENFFFNAGTQGGRILVDLGSTLEIQQINSYSWHANTRAPQVYNLYASEGVSEGFAAQPKQPTDPEKCGWKLIAKVDTRPREGDPGGQYGVSIRDTEGAIGRFRYCLFVISRTEDVDAFGNTFFSEIDILDRNGPSPEVISAQSNAPAEKTFTTEGGEYEITIVSTAAPDLTEWAEKVLAPVALEWYPKIVKLLPSEGFTAPKKVTITLRDGMGGTPAATSGSRISCNIGWFRRNLKGEAVGSVVHEMVHVAQQYGRARRANSNATRTPGWLTEGIPDYIRWFLYEPQTKGAEISQRNLARARYDASYRITANFLNWVIGKYDADLMRNLNTASREGKYTEDLWKQRTGHTVQELGEEWKKALEEKIGKPAN